MSGHVSKSVDSIPDGGSPTPILKQLAQDLTLSGLTVPPNYEEELKRALWTFKYQTVYDPVEVAPTHQ